jgi:hypothetical protein
MAVAYAADINSRVAVRFRAGILKAFKTEGEYNAIQRQTKYPDIEDRPATKFYFYDSTTGYSFSAGLQRQTGTVVLKLDARFDNVGPVINSAAVGFGINVYSITAGVSF